MPVRSWGALGVAVALCVGVAGCGGNAGQTPQSSAPAVSPSVTPLPSSVSPSPSPSPSPTVTPASPSPSTVTTGTLSPTPSESFPVDASLAAQFPDAAKKIPDAVQVVRDFYAGVNHEIDTGDEAEALETFGPSGCLACANQVVEIKDMLVNGNRIRGGHLHILSLDMTFPPGAGEIEVQITGNQDAGELLDAKGNVVKAISAIPPTRLDFEVGIDAKPYLIQQVIRLSP